MSILIISLYVAVALTWIALELFFGISAVATVAALPAFLVLGIVWWIFGHDAGEIAGAATWLTLLVGYGLAYSKDWP